MDFIEVSTILHRDGRVETRWAVRGFRPQHAQAAIHVRLTPDSAQVARALMEALEETQIPVVLVSSRLAAMTPEVRQVLREAVAALSAGGRTVMFKALDFFQVVRERPEQAWDVFSELWEAGVRTFTLGDASGRSLPWEVATGTHEARRRFPRATLGFWMANVNACADDNALSAVNQGANLVHGTLHGYGQGQGYTDLACVAAALWRQHRAGFTTQDLEHLWDWGERLHHWLYAPVPRASEGVR